MTHSVIEGTLASAVANNGTFTVAFPSGKNAGSFYLAMGHILMVAQNKYLYPNGVDISMDATQITVTNKSGGTWAAGSRYKLQLEEPGQRQYREVRDPNDNAISPVTRPGLIASAVHGAMCFVNLGAPDTADPDGILNDKSATDSAQTYDSDNWESTFNGTLDVPRTLSAQGTSGSDHVITITGTDVYGRTMVESLTLSGTTKIWGKKAFKTITTVAVAAGAAGDTFDLGWEDFLGLPVFLPSAGHVMGVMQDGVRLPQKELIQGEIDQTRLMAGTSVYVQNAHAGNIERLSTVLTTAINTTGGSLTVEVATVAVTGLAVVIATGAVGDVDTDQPAAAVLLGTDTTGMVAARAGIEIVGDAAFDSTGALNFLLELNTQGIFAAGIRTAGGSTATTGDVRGTFRPPVNCDGSIVWHLMLALPDPGYAGIAQYAG